MAVDVKRKQAQNRKAQKAYRERRKQRFAALEEQLKELQEKESLSNTQTKPGSSILQKKQTSAINQDKKDDYLLMVDSHPPASEEFTESPLFSLDGVGEDYVLPSQLSSVF